MPSPEKERYKKILSQRSLPWAGPGNKQPLTRGQEVTLNIRTMCIKQGTPDLLGCLFVWLSFSRDYCGFNPLRPFVFFLIPVMYAQRRSCSLPAWSHHSHNKATVKTLFLTLIKTYEDQTDFRDYVSPTSLFTMSNQSRTFTRLGRALHRTAPVQEEEVVCTDSLSLYLLLAFPRHKDGYL